MVGILRARVMGRARARGRGRVSPWWASSPRLGARGRARGRARARARV